MRELAVHHVDAFCHGDGQQIVQRSLGRRPGDRIQSGSPSSAHRR
ncbi:MAG: hypothetical protein R3F43_11355 [bacterium]